MSAVLNALTIDVESFAEANEESFVVPSGFLTDPVQRAEVERNLDTVLAALDSAGCRATFFFLGTVAVRSPRLVTEVAKAGHEVASHSHTHHRVYGQEQGRFRARLSDAKSRLEDLAGQPVVGFRAPDFSITADSLWALDVLQELGFLYDTSMFPIGFHDVYGVAGMDSEIHQLPNGIIEWPLSTATFAGKRFPYGGGGYFRLYPLWLTRRLFENANGNGRPCMFYIHPYEMGSEVARVPVPPHRKFRHYFRTAAGPERVVRFIREFSFAPVREVLGEGGFL